jgi:hypothetical protein
VLGLVRHTRGNISKTMDYFVSASGDHGLLDGYRIVAQQFSTRTEWITGAGRPSPYTAEPDSLIHTPVPWLLIPFALAAWVLFRRRVEDGIRLAIIVITSSVLGVIAVSRTIGLVYAYRLRWTWLIGMFSMVVVVWAAWTAWVARARPRPVLRYRVLAVVAAGALALVVANSVGAATASTPGGEESARLAKVVPALLRTLPERPGFVVVEATSFGSTQYSPGIVLWLQRLGIAARVPAGPNVTEGIGARRVYRGGPVRAWLTVAENSDYDQLVKDPTQKLVAYAGTVGTAERAVLAAQVDAQKVEFAARRISPGEALQRLSALYRRLGTAIVVFQRTP